MNNQPTPGPYVNPDPTPEQEYIRNGGDSCPHCKTSNIAAGAPEYEDSAIYQNVYCSNCDAEWTDEYTLTSVVIHTPTGETK